MKDWSGGEKLGFSLRTGWETPFSEQRVIDEKANDVAKDGKIIGEVIYRWPWSVPRGYPEPTKACSVALITQSSVLCFGDIFEGVRTASRRP